MTRFLAIVLGAAFSISAAPQDPPPRRTQVLLKCSFHSFNGDLRTELQEVDPAFKSLGPEVTRLAKELENEALEDREKAVASIRAVGLVAYRAIKDERDRTKSDQVRFELDAILKGLTGDWPASIGVPSGHYVGPKEGVALKKRLTDLKTKVVHHPSISLVDGVPASIFVGDQVPSDVGRRRVKLDGDAKRLRFEEQAPTRWLKYGLEMMVKTKVVIEADRKSAALDIALMSSYVRRPLRESETPWGRVLDPEVVQLGIDLSPTLASGRSYLAGPFPALEEKGAPWWILLEVEMIRP